MRRLPEAAEVELGESGGSVATRPDDPYSRALAGVGSRLEIRDHDGGAPADFARWDAEPDAADRSVLERCEAPVLDVGCGPGRLVAELVRRQTPALGLDVNPLAVARSSDRGAPALVGSVFGPVPAPGQWGTLLLLDGNVGIGGDPERLLARCAELLALRGRLLVELDPDPRRDDRVEAWWQDDDGVGSPFPWARLGEQALDRAAAAGPLRVVERWTSHGRRFAVLQA